MTDKTSADLFGEEPAALLDRLPEAIIGDALAEHKPSHVFALFSGGNDRKTNT